MYMFKYMYKCVYVHTDEYPIPLKSTPGTRCGDRGKLRTSSLTQPLCWSPQPPQPPNPGMQCKVRIRSEYKSVQTRVFFLSNARNFPCLLCQKVCGDQSGKPADLIADATLLLVRPSHHRHWVLPLLVWPTQPLCWSVPPPLLGGQTRRDRRRNLSAGPSTPPPLLLEHMSDVRRGDGSLSLSLSISPTHACTHCWSVFWGLRVSILEFRVPGAGFRV